MKSVSLYLFFIVVFSACSTLSEISGDYYSSRAPYSFTLNEDSTFIYRYKFEIDYEYSLGKWSKAGKNAVVLNSHYKEKLLQLRTEYSNTVKSDDISLNIVTPDFDREYYECLIFVNGALLAKQKCDSIISVTIRKPVEDVYLGFTADRTINPFIGTRILDTVYTEKLYPQSAFDKCTLRIVYNDSLFNYRVFDSESFKITKKGLIFNDPKRKTRQTLPKK